MRGHRPIAREFVAERASGMDGDECVLWPFKTRDGYGVLHTSRPNRRTISAHRAVLDAAGVLSSDGQTEIRHLCGVRRCVNLRHLKWGTRSENQRDRFRIHGDSNQGERNNRAKLSESAVRFIRRSKDSERSLAASLRVSPAAIYMVRSGQTWSHVSAD